jgi:hypothetical protein
MHIWNNEMKSAPIHNISWFDPKIFWRNQWYYPFLALEREILDETIKMDNPVLFEGTF